jgi:hypothetical protein
MNALEQLALDMARRWDGESTVRTLIIEYARQVGLPIWLFRADGTIRQDDVDELVELVRQELYGEKCDPVAVSNIGKRRPVWI